MMPPTRRPQRIVVRCDRVDPNISKEITIMNRCNLVSLSSIAVIAMGLSLLSSNALAQQKSLKEQLIGTWTLVSSETAAPNGTKQQYFGANPRGILMLDAGGRYAQVWGRADRPKFKA